MWEQIYGTLWLAGETEPSADLWWRLRLSSKTHLWHWSFFYSWFWQTGLKQHGICIWNGMVRYNLLFQQLTCLLIVGTIPADRYYTASLEKSLFARNALQEIHASAWTRDSRMISDFKTMNSVSNIDNNGIPQGLCCLSACIEDLLKIYCTCILWRLPWVKRPPYNERWSPRLNPWQQVKHVLCLQYITRNPYTHVLYTPSLFIISMDTVKQQGEFWVTLFADDAGFITSWHQLRVSPRLQFWHLGCCRE